MSKILYIYTDSFTQFNEYKRNNQLIECHLITDQFFLRAKTPGRILVVDPVGSKWDHQAILESIEVHQRLWNDQLQIQSVNNEDEDITQYGV